MKRISIRFLMGLVLAIAVAIAALRNADGKWASGLILGTPMILATCFIAAVCGRQQARPRRLGFAILGGVYFALAHTGPRYNEPIQLPTTWLLLYIHDQAAPPLIPANIYTVSPASDSTIDGSTVVGPNPNAVPILQPSTTGSTATFRWRRLLPGAVDFDAFSAVGHSLFALLAGALGAVIAQRFHDRASAPASNS